jgi:hypothetical protein
MCSYCDSIAFCHFSRLSTLSYTIKTAAAAAAAARIFQDI